MFLYHICRSFSLIRQFFSYSDNPLQAGSVCSVLRDLPCLAHEQQALTEVNPHCDSELSRPKSN